MISEQELEALSLPGAPRMASNALPGAKATAAIEMSRRYESMARGGGDTPLVFDQGFVGAGGGGQGRIWFWNPADAANTHTVTVPTNARDMTLHPDGTALAIAGANGTCLVYSMTQAPAATPKK